MESLIVLDAKEHAALKVLTNVIPGVYRYRHLLLIRADEAPKAACCFPIFLAKEQETDDWILSCLASFEPTTSLFVDDKGWNGDYLPHEIRTHPFFLTKVSEHEDEEEYAVSVDEESAVLSQDEGEPLFASDGKPSPYLNNVRALLDANLTKDYLTREFIQKLLGLDLFKPLVITVHYQSGKNHRLQGLHTIDEDSLHSLPIEGLKELRDLGYFTPIYAILVSLFQLNSLLNRHNRLGHPPIRQMKMQLGK